MHVYPEIASGELLCHDPPMRGRPAGPAESQSDWANVSAAGWTFRCKRVNVMLTMKPLQHSWLPILDVDGASEMAGAFAWYVTFEADAHGTPWHRRMGYLRQVPALDARTPMYQGLTSDG